MKTAITTGATSGIGKSACEQLLSSGWKVYSLLSDYIDTPMLRELQDGRGFDWGATLKAEDVARLSVELETGEGRLPSGSNVIVVNNALKEDLKSVEKLYGFNTDTGELVSI